MRRLSALGTVIAPGDITCSGVIHARRCAPLPRQRGKGSAARTAPHTAPESQIHRELGCSPVAHRHRRDIRGRLLHRLGLWGPRRVFAPPRNGLTDTNGRDNNRDGSSRDGSSGNGFHRLPGGGAGLRTHQAKPITVRSPPRRL
jgi:hypothetical protein